jgi:hypothetical protein
MSEASEIKRDGARAQRNSGRGILEKGDATLGQLLIDYKEYDESFSVSRKVWAKLSTDAFKAGRRIPVLKLILGSKEDKNKVRVFVVGEAMFMEMYEAWSEKYEGIDE